MTVELYSPQPPSAYTIQGKGHGALFTNNVPAWNLAWLSEPKLDAYLDATIPRLDAVRGVDNELVGAALACFRPEDLEDYPHLAEVLSRPRSEFLKPFLAGPWASLRLFEDYGMPWLETVRRRAGVQGVAAAAEAEVKEALKGNVFYMANYRRRA